MSNKVNYDDDAEVSFLKIELAEMEKLSALRLKLAKAEINMNKKRSLITSSCVSVVPGSNAAKKVKVETNSRRKNSSSSVSGGHQVSNAYDNIEKIKVIYNNTY